MKKARLGGADGYAHRFGRLLNGAFLQLLNLNDYTKGRSQSTDCSAKSSLPFSPQVLCLGVGSPGRNSRTGLDCVEIKKVAVRNFARRALFSEDHERRIDGNPGEPSREARPTVEILNVQKGPQERVLSRVLRILTVFGDAIRRPKNFFHVGLAKFPESIFLPALGRCQQSHLAQFLGAGHRCDATYVTIYVRCH